MKIHKIKNNYIEETLRFDGSYHLAEGTLFYRKIKEKPHYELKDLCSEIFTSGRSKRIYTEKKFGYPYLSNSDVVRINPFDGCNYNSIKYGYDESAVLKEGMIVTGRVGAIGQTAYINSEFEEKKAMGSDNIIRLVCNDKNISGYVYSFLVSKYGKALLERLAAGGVQPYISESMLLNLPVPIFPEEKQNEIHQLIVESGELRVEANKLLMEAIEIIEKKLDFEQSSKKINKISSKNLFDFHHRIDAQYQIKWKEIKDEYKKEIEYRKLSDFASSIFVGGRGKRNYVENGIPFLSSSDMMLFNPKRFSKKISPSTKNIEEMKVDKNDILISRSGTVGNTIIIGDDLKGVAISEHALRLIIDEEKISPFYIYAFLKTQMGLEAMEASAFGSVIITLNEDLIGNIDIPILPSDIIKTISENIEKSINSSDKAVNKENLAISLIEKEIDQWQLS